MTIQKQPVAINFQKGLDLKTDPFQVSIGNFLSLVNSVFTTGGRLTKRNGYSALTALSDTSSTFLTTFNNNLTAIGNKLQAFNEGTGTWIDKGTIQPLELSVLPLIRSNTNQSQVDVAAASNGNICVIYTDNVPISGTLTPIYKYAVVDPITGQNILSPTVITSSFGDLRGSPRVFTLGKYYIIIFSTLSGSTYHLQYKAVNTANPNISIPATNISTSYAPSIPLNYDAVVTNNSLYISLNGGDIGGAIRLVELNSFLSIANVNIFTAVKATNMSVTTDGTLVYTSFWDTNTNNLYVGITDTYLNIVLPPVLIVNEAGIVNLTSVASDGTVTLYYEISNTYSYDSTIPTNYIATATLTLSSHSTTSVFSSGDGALTVASVTGLVVGMSVVDLTTPANLTAGTKITNINTGTKVLTLNQNAAANSASTPGDTLKFATVTTPSIIKRSVGLASKAFLLNEVPYFLAAYQSLYQPTYFLSDGTGNIIAKLAYSNAGLPLPTAGVGYYPAGLPSAIVNENLVQIGYLFKDFITSQNTSTTESVTKSNIYSQAGINLASFIVGTSKVIPGEIANALHLSGGFLWEYDGYSPVEHNFFLWPDNTAGSQVNSGGSMVPQEYQYQFVFTWTDNQGNIHYSAPSIPITVDMSSGNPSFTQPSALTPTADLTAGSKVLTSVSSFTGIALGQVVIDTTTGANIQAGSYITDFDSMAGTITLNLPATATASTNSLSITSICSVTLDVPTLRLTYKTANPIKIEIFRWSVAQQSFFQVTSIHNPLINDTTVDSLSFTDTLSDNQILGNSLIYTTGGVVENIGAPSFNAITLFDDRLWGIDAEDPNLLWFSKQVIEATPVEMSDLLTFYVAPTTAAQGSTGPMKCIAPMDGNLIIFKQNAIYYINGTGPDNTGQNNQYSPPIFITSTVGTTNQQSIVYTDAGLMFQSDKGIWMVLRNVQQAVYIGAPVEQLTLNARVNSATVIPGTTQVRFTLDSGITLMYDYFYQQWGTFKNVPAISSTLYQELHTYLNSAGQIFQETAGSYLDGSSPVLMSITTGWLHIAGISGYQRIYEFQLLGSYISPHKLAVQVAYDFANPIQQSIITPTNYTGTFGSDSLFGQTSPFAGPGTLEQWRVQTEVQKCQTFQITINELFDPSFGTAAGAGFTLSGINCVIGVKKGYRPLNGSNTVG
jgi:hypothetical protein